MDISNRIYYAIRTIPDSLSRLIILGQLEERSLDEIFVQIRFVDGSMTREEFELSVIRARDLLWTALSQDGSSTYVSSPEDCTDPQLGCTLLTYSLNMASQGVSVAFVQHLLECQACYHDFWASSALASSLRNERSAVVTLAHATGHSFSEQISKKLVRS